MKTIKKYDLRKILKTRKYYVCKICKLLGVKYNKFTRAVIEVGINLILFGLVLFTWKVILLITYKRLAFFITSITHYKNVFLLDFIFYFLFLLVPGIALFYSVRFTYIKMKKVIIPWIVNSIDSEDIW